MGCKRTNVGNVYRSKRWAKRWAKGRRIKKVKGGYKIMSGKVKTPAQQRERQRQKKRRRRHSRDSRDARNWFLG